MPGKLTTHVLDTAQGCPAAHLRIELWQIDPQTDYPEGGTASHRKTLLKTLHTNADGRTNQPLLSDAEFQPGTYELVFTIGDYFKQQPIPVSEPPFLDRVPIQFTIADPNAHYHVPLLASPWSYSTYRGS
ncbi:hydroxyisourate hydrolase [Leptolyngbya ohadii]|uniref:hydroxyisourate hydrolase n=1 Tax=Leptolyngbya ohadii TaxID=1962290 RepID=UPI000B5A1EF8|nr:hydroxyisourate hydrolase [Leptolyngbya ohadii]